jgi:sec-independent protein translocase protein TatB
MFNIGGGEFLVIALIALIVLGPQRLPEAARQVGKVMGDLRRLSSGFQNELKGALDDDRGPTPVPARDVLAVEPPPVVEPEPPTATPAPAAKRAPAANGSRAPRRAPLQAGPVPKAPRPRSKG